MISYLKDDLVKLFLGGLKHEVGGPGRSLGAAGGEEAVRRIWAGLLWSWL